MGKKALLIGNQEYYNMGKLNLPERDVEKLSNILGIIGFDVVSLCNLTFEDMNRAISDFESDIKDDDEIIFYFSGHGYNFEGHNYIAPIDCLDCFDIKLIDVINSTYNNAAKVVDIEWVVSVLKRNQNGINILLIDACRNIQEGNMYNDKRIGGFIETPVYGDNFFISFATALGKFTYEEQLEEECGIYVSAISKVIFRKGQTLDEMFHCVTDYLYWNSKYGLKPWINKSILKSYVLIDESNYNYDIEKRYFDDMIEIYEFFSYEYSSNVESVEQVEKYLYDCAIGSLFYPRELMFEYIGKMIAAFEEDLGLIYLFLEDNLITRVDVYKDNFAIETKSGQRILYGNKEYYQIEKCFDFIRAIVLKESSISMDIYYYKNKTIILCKKPPFTESSFQIIGSSNNKLLDIVVDYPINKIAKHDESKEIKEIIKKYIKDNKNILVLGDPFTSKEEFVSGFSNYFRERDKVLVLNEDKKIEIFKGQRNEKSTEINYLIKKSEDELDIYINEAISQGTNRIICPQKLFRRDKNFFKKIFSIKNCQLLMIKDCNINYFEININSSSDDIISAADLIIILDRCDGIGSYVSSVYEKKENEFQCKIRIEIDKIKLNKNAHKNNG